MASRAISLRLAPKAARSALRSARAAPLCWRWSASAARLLRCPSIAESAALVRPRLADAQARSLQAAGRQCIGKVSLKLCVEMDRKFFQGHENCPFSLAPAG